MYNIHNLSNQLIVCSLADETTLRLYPFADVQIKAEQKTAYLDDLAKAGMITIKEVVLKVEEPIVVDEKKKSPKNDKKEEK